MKNRIMILGALMLTLSVVSCQKDSDVVLNYGVNDNVAFGEAFQSYAGKFKVFWKSMNTTYSLWDYEKECGLDWDEYYNEMLPKFEALDKQDSVSDKELEMLMREMAAPLHDGHLTIKFQNHKTGKYVRVSPNEIRNEQRPDFEFSKKFVPDLTAYRKNQELLEWSEADTQISSQFKYLTMTEGIGYQWALAKHDELIQKENPTERDASMLSALKDFIKEMRKLVEAEKFGTDALKKFNELATEYSYLNIPFLEPISTAFDENGISVKYALFKDNIAYFYLSDFALTPYLHNASFNKNFSDSKHATEVAKMVREVYYSWFGAIQQLHKDQQLKGVIIDLRSNRGGFAFDSQYVLGSLAPKGGLEYGYARFKRGPGRFDYSPFMPMTAMTMDADHEVIDDVPVTLLINCWSVSMSEITSLSSKLMPNARLIGRRSWGGLCGLTDSSDFSKNYTGYIGVENETPVYVYLPVVGVFDKNKKMLDGYGVEPDIEVDFDKDEYEHTGYDSQLNRALQYIRTGN
ncbi:MAG: hypothetical protein IJP46_03435 [Prevotella sp.]|nr:hypothetical protein [Prevotella sp.]